MPRKDDVKKNRSKNERSQQARGIDPPSQASSYDYNDLARVIPQSPGTFLVSNMGGVNNYSDFVRNANVSSNGWYSTIANGLPFLKNLHNSLLGRDAAEDYLENNGLDWGDMEGYNDIKLLGRAASGVSGLTHEGSTYLDNISSDLGKLYSGQKVK